MNLSWKIARRYLFSKKSTNAINIISIISMTGMTVCTASFILILSVFNGFEGLVIRLYDSFYPDIRVKAIEGKFFPATDSLVNLISLTEGVEEVSRVLEENAMLVYDDRQHIATVKGVDSLYHLVTGIDTSMLPYGTPFDLWREGRPQAVIGAGIDHLLQVNLTDPFASLNIIMPTRKLYNPLSPDAFSQTSLEIRGVFAIQDEFDNQYVFAPLSFIREMQGYGNEVSALEISLSDGVDRERVKKRILESIGEGYVVETKYEQNAFLYRIMNIEKLVVYIILTLVLIIVAFNMVGSLSMLVIDKRKDIGVMKTMGATAGLIRRIFIAEGMLQAILSIMTGFLIAITLCLVQQQFGFIRIQGSGTFVVQYYPVKMKIEDFVAVSLIVLGIALIASWFPAQRASRPTRIFLPE